MKLKNYFGTMLLMTGISLGANAQRFTHDIPTVYDGMDSITVHYNPFGTGGDHGDTVFQTTTSPLYAYMYLTDSTSAGGSVVGTYNNGGWTSIEVPVNRLTMVSATDWKFTIPNVRQFFSVPKNVYVTGVNIIIHDTGTGGGMGIVQSQNGYLPVSESFALTSTQVLSTGPVTSPPGTLLADGNENVVVYYHPQNDTSHYGTVAAHDGDQIFKTYTGNIFVYAYVQKGGTSIGSSQELRPWGSVGTTPAAQAIEIDSNNYAWDLTSLRGNFIAAGLPSGTSIDTLAVIYRNAAGDTQTINLYIPLVILPTEITNVNGIAAKTSIYPNPATSGVLVSYAFEQQNNTTVIVTNAMGQTVMTQELGQKTAGNVYLSVSDIPAGIYQVTVTNGSSRSTQRLVKQ